MLVKYHQPMDRGEGRTSVRTRDGPTTRAGEKSSLPVLVDGLDRLGSKFGPLFVPKLFRGLNLLGMYKLRVFHVKVFENAKIDEYLPNNNGLLW